MREARKEGFDDVAPASCSMSIASCGLIGSMRWVFVKGRVSFVGEGPRRAPKRGVGFVLDITERKAAERALKESEQRYRTLVDNANDIVATLDLEGRFTSVNPAVVRILGYTPQELMGVPIDDLIPPEFVSLQDDVLRRKLEGEASTQYELDILAKGTGKTVTLDVQFEVEVRRRWQASRHTLDCARHHGTERSRCSPDPARARVAASTKNLLAVVQSIATSTFGTTKDPKIALEAFVGRLHALGACPGIHLGGS